MSIQQRREMDLWTIYKAAGAKFSSISFMNTEAAEKQVLYVTSTMENRSPYQENYKGWDFLIDIGRCMSAYLESLEELPEYRIAALNLSRTVNHLESKQSLLLKENYYILKDPELASQLETASKVILLFAQEMGKMFPSYTQHLKNAYLEKENVPKRIEGLEQAYLLDVEELFIQLESLHEKFLINLGDKLHQTLSEYPEIQKPLNWVKQESGNLVIYLSESTSQEILEEFNSSKLGEYVDDMLYNVSIMESLHPKSSLKGLLAESQDILSLMKKHIDLIDSYQKKMPSEQSIKEFNFDFFESLKEDLFKKILDQLSVKEESKIQQKDEEELIFKMDDFPPINQKNNVKNNDFISVVDVFPNTFSPSIVNKQRSYSSDTISSKNLPAPLVPKRSSSDGSKKFPFYIPTTSILQECINRGVPTYQELIDAERLTYQERKFQELHGHHSKRTFTPKDLADQKKRLDSNVNFDEDLIFPIDDVHVIKKPLDGN
jgi:hypothetical protein